ncbi:hypothetical protein [Methylorubrum salsuginis]|uniref:hypothetical protein n=1 Tax=Methylorubrum salsuginis TaxID=414703 RepID=UPI0010424A4B|nr:hypothetical protein [Methylorubrum salsuginis]
MKWSTSRIASPTQRPRCRPPLQGRGENVLHQPPVAEAGQGIGLGDTVQLADAVIEFRVLGGQELDPKEERAGRALDQVDVNGERHEAEGRDEPRIAEQAVPRLRTQAVCGQHEQDDDEPDRQAGAARPLPRQGAEDQDHGAEHREVALLDFRLGGEAERHRNAKAGAERQRGGDVEAKIGPGRAGQHEGQDLEREGHAEA